MILRLVNIPQDSVIIELTVSTQTLEL